MRTLKKNILVLFISCIIALILAEIIVRVFPDKFSIYLNPPISTFKDRLTDDDCITFANQKGSWNRECFRIYPVCTNSLGFRGNEWNANADFKIGILGDSFMMALETPEGVHTCVILARLLNKEVLNTAVRRYGTVNELLAYRKFLKPLKINIAILFFHIDTDVRDNSCELVKLIYGTNKIYKPCAYICDGKVEIKTNFDRPGVSEQSRFLDSAVKKFIKNNCLSCGVIYRYTYTKYIYKILFPQNKNFLDVYIPPRKKNWEEAWVITEKTLIDLKREVEADGGKLLVVVIPGEINFLKGRKQVKRSTGLASLPEEFDTLYPAKRIERISQSNGIQFLALLPYFIEYKDKFHLRHPYFSYFCDGHWNPLGHFLVSNIVAKYLIEQDWIPLSDEEKAGRLEKIGRNLNLSPLEILGKEAYRQIYHRGLYLGSSNISKIMQDQNN